MPKRPAAHSDPIFLHSSHGDRGTDEYKNGVSFGNFLFVPLGVPFVGFLLDKRTSFDVCLVAGACGIVYGVLGLTQHVVPQIISISIFVFLRPLMYTFGESGGARGTGLDCVGDLV